MKQTVIFDMTNTIYRKKRFAAQSLKQDSDGAVKVGGIQVEAMPQALEVFLHFYEQGYKIVIISAAGIQNNRQILQTLLAEYGLEQDEIKKIFDDIDILTTRFFGSKYDSDAWKQAMEPYKNIEYIFEDGEGKIQAAGQASEELGHDPELYLSTAEYAQEHLN